jgi:hypothetical protein
MVDIHVQFARPRVEDLPQAVGAALGALPSLRALEQGQVVAITAGSRGIANIAEILREAVRHVRRLGAAPVVVSAMGSHGGNTAGGQRALLASLGITEQSVGAEVHCSTETVEVTRTEAGVPVRIDRFAAEHAAGILVINRVKPHTAFHGTTESGLLKMLAVGLGRQPGASLVHGLGPSHMAETIRAMARAALGRLPVLGGLAILENAYDETAEVVPLPAQSFLGEEEALLARAKALMPRLPVNAGEVLIVEQIGKEISGTGMDTNIVGRFGPEGQPAPDAPSFRRLVVLDLTPASHGNATGIGLADFTTDRLVAAIDRLSTYTNCLTSTLIDRARLPLYLPDDRQAIAAAVLSLGASAPEEARVAQIRDTLHLGRVRVSENLLSSLSAPPGARLTVQERAADDMDPAARPGRLTFDGAGNLARLPCGGAGHGG